MGAMTTYQARDAAAFNAADRARTDNDLDLSVLARYVPSPTLDVDLGLGRSVRSPTDTGDDPYGVMPLSGRRTVTRKLGGWSNAAEVVLVASKTHVSDVRNEIHTPDYGLLNLRTCYAWRIDAWRHRCWQRRMIAALAALALHIAAVGALLSLEAKQPDPGESSTPRDGTSPAHRASTPRLATEGDQTDPGGVPPLDPAGPSPAVTATADTPQGAPHPRRRPAPAAAAPATTPVARSTPSVAHGAGPAKGIMAAAGPVTPPRPPPTCTTRPPSIR
jgi:hypothetical protein